MPKLSTITTSLEALPTSYLSYDLNNHPVSKRSRSDIRLKMIVPGVEPGTYSVSLELLLPSELY